jgi:hypothetical protein
MIMTLFILTGGGAFARGIPGVTPLPASAYDVDYVADELTHDEPDMAQDQGYTNVALPGEPGQASEEKAVVEQEKKPGGEPVKKAAEEKKKAPARVKVFAGTWDESYRNASKSADYCFSYYGVNYGNLHMRFDTFNFDRRRYWLTYGKIPIANSPEFVMSISPGIMINNVYINRVKRDQFYEGGFAHVQFPKLGLTILEKSYGGTDGDFHHTFADLRLMKFLDLSYFNYCSYRTLPDTYLGPKLKINAGKDASFAVWYGFGLLPEKPNARLLNISGSITF